MLTRKQQQQKIVYNSIISLWKNNNFYVANFLYFVELVLFLLVGIDFKRFLLIYFEFFHTLFYYLNLTNLYIIIYFIIYFLDTNTYYKNIYISKKNKYSDCNREINKNNNFSANSF